MSTLSALWSHICILQAHTGYEIHNHISCANAAPSKLNLWKLWPPKFKPNSYYIFHKAVFLPTLVYGAETWTTYRRHLKVLGCSDHVILILDQRWLLVILDGWNLISITSLTVQLLGVNNALYHKVSLVT